MKRFILFLLIFLISCSSTGQIPAPPPIVPSLKDNITPLLQQSKKWAEDAYLVNADIPLNDMVFPYAITAEFRAPSRPYEQLGIDLYRTGKITTKTYQISVPVSQLKPIEISDWSIDSQIALNIMWQEISESHGAYKNPCGNLELQREPSLTGEGPVVWILTIHECHSIDSEYIYLDPTSGKVLKIVDG